MLLRGELVLTFSLAFLAAPLHRTLAQDEQTVKAGAVLSSSDAVALMTNVQDERLGDILSVQDAIQNLKLGESADLLLKEFAARDEQRTAKAGAASLQLAQALATQPKADMDFSNMQADQAASVKARMDLLAAIETARSSGAPLDLEKVRATQVAMTSAAIAMPVPSGPTPPLAPEMELRAQYLEVLKTAAAFPPEQQAAGLASWQKAMADQIPKIQPTKMPVSQ